MIRVVVLERRIDDRPALGSGEGRISYPGPHLDLAERAVERAGEGVECAGAPDLAHRVVAAVERREDDRIPVMRQRVARVGGDRRALDGVGPATGQACPLLVDPLLELRRAVDHVKPGDERPAVQLERFGVTVLGDRALELQCVAPDDIGAQAQFVAARTLEYVVAERTAEEVHRLAERVACMLGVVLGPEERRERVAPMRTARPSEDQIGEQRKPLGLGDEHADLRAVSGADVDRAERTHADHAAAPSRLYRDQPR
jgi:hypothetical protein